ncbi:hypothetical protein FB45DRAFT_942568 [Roridomyces roridus]|uniref:Uncharacterized protein n=1 Tax=Roridomyces roridus TaxID=1738132 RepID=A0AAD7B4L0_9AGAR|nr:hypothetical protein FB45DRAFT_942568 [Roridomyces roridus]
MTTNPVTPPRASGEDAASVVSGDTTKASSEAARSEATICPRLIPIAPQAFERYIRQRRIVKRKTEYMVPPLTRSFSRPAPLEWAPHHHPEGGLYFLHEQRRILTDAYLYEALSIASITSAVEHILSRAGVLDLLSGNCDIDLVLDLRQPNEVGYYFVDHSARTIFWLDVFNMNALEGWQMVDGIEEESHILLISDISTRQHCEYFPVAVPASPALVQVLCDMIVFGIGDTMTSPTTTQSFSNEYLFRMLNVAKELVFHEGLSSNGDFGPNMMHGSVFVLTRFMKEFTIARFYNFHGERAARLSSGDTVYESEPENPSLLPWVAPLLFNSPLHHIRRLQKVSTDKVINFASWQKLVTDLRSDWQELVLYGTLVINTNVGFLAIPTGGNSSIGRVASYASICFSLGSVILGIRLLREYRLQDPNVTDIGPARRFFRNHKTKYGLELLSIYLALPYGFMIWSIFTFIMAFIISVYETSTSTVRGIMLAIVLAVCVPIVGFALEKKHLALWTLFTGVKKSLLLQTMDETKERV